MSTAEAHHTPNASPRVPRHLRQPLYSYAEADQLAGVSRGTSKRWLRGYSYDRAGERMRQPPVAAREGSGEGVSFSDLVEVVAIGKFRELGFSSQQVRKVVDAAQESFGVAYPLSRLEFKTDGRDVFVRQGTILHDVLRNRAQMAWDQVLAPFLETLDYRAAIAYRWWPLGKDRPIIIDPEYGFGLPVVAGSGIRTEIIRERLEAGDSYDQVADDFNLERQEIEGAVQFELRRAA